MDKAIDPANGGQRSGWHRANPVALVFGLVFCGISIGWLLLDQGVLATTDLQWTTPALFIGAGLAGIGVSLGQARRSRRAT